MSYFETAGGVPPHESHTGLWIGGMAALIAFIAAVFLVVSANTPRVGLHAVSLAPPPSVTNGSPIPASSPAP
jgi:hypothetical protein